MRIICAEIAGFGSLSQMHMDFEEGLNSFLEENGWGKTTLCVFIKSMLYGMPYSRARKVLSEREHYRPWSVGVYGGSLVIELKGKRYRIERSFGKKDSQDSFALYDDVTGLASEDYSENIGQEIFQVDRESFEKSVFIPQENTATRMTDSLNAKMGDLALAQDDINHFDEAKKRLEDAKRIYTKNSKLDPGKLLRVKNELKKCNEAAEQLPILSDAMEKQKQVLSEKNDAMRTASLKKARLAEEIAVVSKNEQKLGIYREKKESCRKLKEEHERLGAFFKGSVPDRNELDRLDELERRLEADRTTRNTIAVGMPDEEERERLSAVFADRVPDDETLRTWEEKAERMLSLRLKSEHFKLTEEENATINELKQFFSKRIPTEDELQKAVADTTELAQLEGQVETLEDAYRNLAVKNRATTSGGTSGSPRGGLYGILIAAVCAVGAVLIRLLVGGTIGKIISQAFVVAAVIVAAATVAIIIRSRRIASNKQKEASANEEAAEGSLRKKEEQRDLKQRECLDFLDDFNTSSQKTYAQMVAEIRSKKESYDSMMAREKQAMEASSESIEELSELVMELYSQLEPFAEFYGMNLHEEHCETSVIDKIKADKVSYLAYRDSATRSGGLERDIGEAEKRLSEFFQDYELEADSDKERLLEIRKKRDNYNAESERLKALEEELYEFKKNSNVNEFTRPVELLQKEQDELDAEISSVSEQIVKAKETLSELVEKFEELEEICDRKPYLEEKETEYKKLVARYDDTITYLTRAKEMFLARYMNPLREGLKGYLKQAGAKGSINISDEDISIDMNLNILLSKDGHTRSSDYLSAGYRDLTSVCARLALIDVLYRKEKPFLILDDPFANLDDEKTKKALSLLKDAAGSRQVIYFTCHDSRIV